MGPKSFRAEAHKLVDWMADYMEHIEDQTVMPDLQPGAVKEALPELPPEKAESFDAQFQDFETLIVPNMTHWQHPGFFAYFPANASPPSVLAEMLTATLGAQCMSWNTSPAATELEVRMIEWLASMIGLPGAFTGVIQDSASSATLCAILTARERATRLESNRKGLASLGSSMTVYGSTECHSSIEKAVRIAGIGSDNFRKIAVDEDFALRAADLEAAIKSDIAAGFRPICVVAAIGTTSSGAIDPVREIAEVCRRYDVWLHVDAAWAGSALILPENRWSADGVEAADSFVFNPHKWLFTNFDCSAYFVKDAEALTQTLGILPEYLKAGQGSEVPDYRDWGIPLGRRFRALKLWFVIRTYGVEGLRERIRDHIACAKQLATVIDESKDFERLAPCHLALVCFRYRPLGNYNESEIDLLNQTLVSKLNKDGRIFLTHTRLNDHYTIRFSVGQTNTKWTHVSDAWDAIKAKAHELVELSEGARRNG